MHERKIMLEADKEYCHRCDADTRWLPTRRGSLKCVGCGDVFPCPKSKRCGHWDCAQEHGRPQEMPAPKRTKKVSRATAQRLEQMLLAL